MVKKNVEGVRYRLKELEKPIKPVEKLKKGGYIVPTLVGAGIGALLGAKRSRGLLGKAEGNVDPSKIALGAVRGAAVGSLGKLLYNKARNHHALRGYKRDLDRYEYDHSLDGKKYISKGKSKAVGSAIGAATGLGAGLLLRNKIGDVHPGIIGALGTAGGAGLGYLGGLAHHKINRANRRKRSEYEAVYSSTLKSKYKR